MNEICKWLKNYSRKSGDRGFVVGVSGGIDSALTSTLCAMTGVRTIVVSMPILQQAKQLRRARLHIEWLKKGFSNVEAIEIDLSDPFEKFQRVFPDGYSSELGFANSRSRLRMAALYQVATSKNGLVVGTGNKVEDFGVGFFTKYGDGGVDLSPIGDLFKSEVREMARELGVLSEIVEAPPTDGLWDDDRTDEDQLGATYEELEWAMSYSGDAGAPTLTERQREVLRIFEKHNRSNHHKMEPIPVFKKPSR